MHNCINAVIMVIAKMIRYLLPSFVGAYGIRLRPSDMPSSKGSEVIVGQNAGRERWRRE